MGYKFVEVVWDDAVSAAGWLSPGNLPEPERIRTRGWLISEKDDYVVLASSIDVSEDEDLDVGATWTIPRGMIVEVNELDC